MTHVQVTIVDDRWERFDEVLSLVYDVLYSGFEVDRNDDWHHRRDGGEWAVALVGDRLIGTARLLPSDEAGARQLRQVAVGAGSQGSGVGRLLVSALESYATQSGTSEIWLNARETAFGFYERLGYEYSSEPFVSELTRLVHRCMRKRLS